ncbi:HD domain-containing protein [Cellulophaga sp. E16_2]|uniref:Metal dependent phosphohydrolase n=1 Tax=Cellulophaga algicola (strain DSM 14237 / IC166 / ACAM 630) TaxID=688270 RepID=E6XCN5_CELAD|nr:MULTISPECIES: HD domain-containing protein [Cellulophaga]ADV49024.1 metal dependent phosphohydrolase [Cellulophaga algicola DSM 14237]MBO0591478.1 HD domain-containing protein [Cellulophaga sp. E16_2]
MTNTTIIEETIAFVKETLQGAEGGHDWFHIQRVFRTSLLIAKDEKDIDTLVVSLGALLHDIADAKFHDGDETVGPKLAQEFLNSLKVDKKIIEHVVLIIDNISFKKTLEVGGAKFTSKELDIIQDADRLDAIGAIGIARAFNYGGFKNRELYNPDIAPNLHMTKEAYKKSSAPTINHFYEKLLLLKDKMNTKNGKILAEQRHQFMLDYLAQFSHEWNPQSL